MTTPVRFGIVSTARIDKKVVPAIAEGVPGKSIAIAISSRDPAKAKEFAKELGYPELRAMTYDEMLEDPEIEAVYVSLPSALRNEFLRKAAQHGKHAYAEKPFAGTFGEISSMIDAFTSQNLQFMDGTMWPHSIRTREIERRLTRGDIGEVQRVTSAFTFKAPDEEWLNGGDIRTNKSKEPMGCFGDQGWYAVGAIMFAFKYELPVRVQITSVAFNNVDTIVACSGLIWFPGERMGVFDCGVLLAHRSYVEIAGTEGIIRVDDLPGGQGRTGDWSAYDEPGYVGSGEFIQGDEKGKDSIVHVEPCDHVNMLVEDFVDAVRSEKVARIWPDRTVACVHVMTALFESATNGCKVVDVGSIK